MVFLASADMPRESGLVDDCVGMFEIGTAGDDHRKLVEKCGSVLFEGGGFRRDQNGVFPRTVGGFPAGQPFKDHPVIISCSRVIQKKLVIAPNASLVRSLSCYWPIWICEFYFQHEISFCPCLGYGYPEDIRG